MLIVNNKSAQIEINENDLTGKITMNGDPEQSITITDTEQLLDLISALGAMSVLVRDE